MKKKFLPHGIILQSLPCKVLPVSCRVRYDGMLSVRS